ncbi:transcriptional regulator [Enterococcus faecalis]|nr:transcriptional regulator [Enterococcus faecalis]EIW2179420.1 transcriptional regulator [Enterococcus faecalis]ELT8920283.1 transcriptional regulator [Enterococcus faecalis]
MDIEEKRAVKEFLSTIVSEESANQLVNLEGQNLNDVYYTLQEQMEYEGLVPEEPTVKSVINEILELLEINLSGDFGIKDYQDLIYQKVDMLSSILGIE